MKVARYNKEKSVELEKANRVINQFVTSCSHSMRGPLKSIKGLVSLLYKSREIPELDAIQFLDLIEQSAYKMENMLDELEQILENSKREITIKKINWDELLQSVLERYQKEISLAQITIEIAVDQSVDFSSDPLRLHLILSHIVENAIQFQRQLKTNQFIHIVVHTNSLNGIIRISDNGIGIEEGVQDKIFELFYRATAASKGVGVGLYVVSEAVEKMGGSITVDSVLGAGSVFTLTLPNLASTKKMTS